MFKNLKLYVLLTGTIINACTNLNKENYSAKEKLEALIKKYVNEEELPEEIIKIAKPRYIKSLKDFVPQEYYDKYITPSEEVYPADPNCMFLGGMLISEFKDEKTEKNLDELFYLQIKKDFYYMLKVHLNISLDELCKFLEFAENFVPSQVAEMIVDIIRETIEKKAPKILGTKFTDLITLHTWDRLMQPTLDNLTQNIQNETEAQAIENIKDLAHVMDYIGDSFLFESKRFLTYIFYNTEFLNSAINQLPISSLPCISKIMQRACKLASIAKCKYLYDEIGEILHVKNHFLHEQYTTNRLRQCCNSIDSLVYENKFIQEMYYKELDKYLINIMDVEKRPHQLLDFVKFILDHGQRLQEYIKTLKYINMMSEYCPELEDPFQNMILNLLRKE